MKHFLSTILDVKMDESVAGVLLGVVVTGLVAWGSSVVTYCGLRRNFAGSKAEKRAAVDLRMSTLSVGSGDISIGFDLVNFGAIAASKVRVTAKSADDGSSDDFWFAFLGPREVVPVTFMLPRTPATSTSEIDVEIKYENGLREKGVSRTKLIMLAGGGVKRQAI